MCSFFLPGPQSRPPSGLKFGILKAWYIDVLLHIGYVHILSTFSSFVQVTVITMHWTNLNMQFENIVWSYCIYEIKQQLLVYIIYGLL